MPTHVVAFVLVALIATATACRGSAHDAAAAAPSGPAAWFVDLAGDSGLRFVHVNGMAGRHYFPEVMPPGAGLLDFDNDGDLDVFLVQGGRLGTSSGGAASSPAAPGGRLFRNDLSVSADGTRRMRFVDVTDRSGIRANEYGMGVAAGDVDNDGWTDLYLTNFGANQLYRNNHDGTFTDVSRQSGTGNSGFSVSAAFVDYDRDGWLDLYVAGYVQYSIASDRACTDLAGVRGYCPPQVYDAAPDHLYRNRGNGTFVDVTDHALLGHAFGRGLGVVTADFNDDGWIDIYVANDGGENLLWINLRNGTFRDEALTAGVAVTGEGHAEASMGVDAGDFDNDGDADLFMTELNGEGSNLYVNDGKAQFEDRSAPSGLGPASLQYTGFGTGWFDFDNDGWLDLLSVNGRVQAAEGTAGDTFPMHQRKLLFRNLGNGRFEDVTARAGAVFLQPQVGRGAAFGDIDNDGDEDVLVANDTGPAQLLVNTFGEGGGGRHHWIGLRLAGTPAHRDMPGARVEIVRSGQPSLWRQVRADGSYASANDPRVLVGLGESAAVPRVRVRWPDGRTEEWNTVGIDRWQTLVEGSSR
jgi:enediyne biosynthesis protein E4